MLETSTPNRWLLNRLEDYSGNAIRLDYTKEPNFAYLSTVTYANRVIKFAYDSSRADIQRRFYKNFLDFQINKLLTNISITVNGREIKQMHLDYAQSDGQAAKISLLKRVRVCANNEDEQVVDDYETEKNENGETKIGTGCMRPLVFDYEQTRRANQLDSWSSVIVGDLCGEKMSDSSSCDLKLLQLADMNGDGLTDLVAFGSDGLYVSLNEGVVLGRSYSDSSSSDKVSFAPAQKWTTDFSNTFFGWDSSKHVRYLVDLNADGLPDLMGIFDNGVYVSINANGYFRAIQKWSDLLGYVNGGYHVGTHPRWPVDVNNDGLPDLVFANSTVDSGGLWIAYNENGKRFADPIPTVKGEFRTDAGFGSTYPVMLIDMDGDGVKERVGFGANGFLAGRLFEPIVTATLSNSFGGSYWVMQDH